MQCWQYAKWVQAFSLFGSVVQKRSSLLQAARLAGAFAFKAKRAGFTGLPSQQASERVERKITLREGLAYATAHAAKPFQQVAASAITGLGFFMRLG